MKAFNFAIIAGLAALLLPTTLMAQNARAGQELVEAVREKDGAKVNDLLANRSALVDARADDGDTALMAAINARDEDFTGFLLNKGADANLPGKKGETPLIAATRLGFDTAVGWLLESGARVDGTNRGGETALIVAVQMHLPMIVRRLLAAGADADKADHTQGFSARDYASRDPRARDILKLIADKKPRP